MEEEEDFSLESSQSTGREKTLENQCEKMWEKLFETHSRIQSRMESSPPRGLEKDLDDINIIKSILKTKEKKLNAELMVIKNEEIKVPPKEEPHDENYLKKKLKERTSNLEDTLSVMEMQRQEIVNELERENEIFQQHLEIQRSIQSKIADMEQEKENPQSGDSQIKDIERKQRTVESEVKELIKKLGAFIKEHFPLPTAKDIKERQKELPHGIKTLDNNETYISLHQLVEALLHQLYASPHDLYIKIQSHHWPPYIELLLRCGIALRHQQDCNLIKLESFQA